MYEITKNLIILSLFILVFSIYLNDAFADNHNIPSISVDTELSTYENGDTIIVTGHIKNYDSFYFFDSKAFSPENDIVNIGQHSAESDGTFSYSFIAGGPLWKSSGEYTIKINYGGSKGETTINYVDGEYVVPSLPPSPEKHNDQDNQPELYYYTHGGGINPTCDSLTQSIFGHVNSEFPVPVKVEIINPWGKIVGFHEETVKGNFHFPIDMDYEFGGKHLIYFYYKGEIYEESYSWSSSSQITPERIKLCLNDNILIQKPEIINEDFKLISKTLYKNNEHGFSIEYPSKMSLTENYSNELIEGNGIVKFENDDITISVNSKTAGVVSNNEDHFEKMSDKTRNWCESKSASKDGFDCSYIIIQTNIIEIDKKITYSLTDRVFYTESLNSPYDDSTEICQIYHVIDDDVIWELAGCVNYLDELIKKSQLTPFAESLYVIIDSLNTFTVLENKVNDSKFIQPEKKNLAGFVDKLKDPQSYVDRYNNEPSYKKWFDDNYPGYDSIEQAVGLELTKKIPDWVKNIFGWYSQDQVSEDELLNAIKYLITEKILIIN